MNILVIEDNHDDLRHYQSLFKDDIAISLLFFNRDSERSKENIIETLKIFCEGIINKFKDYLVATPNETEDFLKKNIFDFYIIDSLNNMAESLIEKMGLSKNKIAILSSTRMFREIMTSKGYRTYKKEEIEDLIEDCLEKGGLLSQSLVDQDRPAVVN